MIVCKPPGQPAISDVLFVLFLSQTALSLIVFFKDFDDEFFMYFCALLLFYFGYQKSFNDQE